MSKRIAKRQRGYSARRLRRLHRWAGIVSALFLLWLALTGLVLNHSSGLGLDDRYLAARWVLDRYNVGAPDVGAAFRIDGAYLSLVEDELYLDAQPLGIRADALVGAVPLGEYIAVSDGLSLRIIDRRGSVLEAWPLETEVGIPVVALAAAQGGVALRTANRNWYFDWAAAQILPLDAARTPASWPAPESVDTATAAAIATAWRRHVISWERFLLDLHSGRFAGISGALVLDLSAIALCLLALTGVLIWLRR